MPCSCGDSNCFCFEKCLCPAQLCRCIICTSIMEDEVNDAKPESTYPEFSPKTSLYSNNSKTLISSDPDAFMENLFVELDGINSPSTSKTSFNTGYGKTSISFDVDAYTENLSEQFDRIDNRSISKTSLYTGNSKIFNSLDADAHAEGLFEKLDGIEDNDVILCGENLNSNKNYSPQLDDISQTITSSDSDCEIVIENELDSSIQGRSRNKESFKKESEGAFDSLLNTPKGNSTIFPKTIRTYSKEKKTDQSKYGPWHTFPSNGIYDLQNESYTSDLADDSNSVNSNRLSEPQPTKNVEKSRWLTYSQFSRNAGQSNRSSTVPSREEIEETRKSLVSSYPEPSTRNYESSTEVCNESGRQESVNSTEHKQLQRIPRSEISRGSRLLDRYFTNPADQETNMNSKLSVYDFCPSEFENKCERGPERNKYMQSIRRGPKRARQNKRANLTSLPEATAIGSNKAKRQLKSKKNSLICKTEQGNFNSQKEEIKPMPIEQGKPVIKAKIKTERNFFQKGIKILRPKRTAKSMTIKKEKL